MVYMSIGLKTKETLLHALFHSLNTQLTSNKSLYDQVKNKGITNDEIKEFVKNQESKQLFNKHERIKKIYIFLSMLDINLRSYNGFS